MTLRLDNSPCPSGCSGKPYASGEYRTNDFYGYGKFETRLKAASGSGLNTSFFTYSGPSDSLPHDEIDVEILGKDTTKMQVNYFVDDVGGHEQMIDLGFDASAGFHNYAIVWSADHIQWYVDDKMVWMVSASSCTPLPTTPGRVMVNLWAGTGGDGWLGPFCDFTHLFSTDGNICLPVVHRNVLFFDSSKTSAERKLNHPFAGSTNRKQQLAEST